MSDSSSALMVSYLNARKIEVYDKMLARNSNQQSFELYREYEEIEERLRRYKQESDANASTIDKRKQPGQHDESAAKSDDHTTGGADVVMDDWDAAPDKAASSPKRHSKRRRCA